jgi:hypothetical protein
MSQEIPKEQWAQVIEETGKRKSSEPQTDCSILTET